MYTELWEEQWTVNFDNQWTSMESLEAIKV